MKLPSVLMLVFFLVIPVITIYFTGIVIGKNYEWYGFLAKPYYMPIDNVYPMFAYSMSLMFGLSAFMVYFSKPTAARKRALIFFGVQLFLTILTVIVFFHFRALDYAIIVGAVQLINTLLYVRYTFKTNIIAGTFTVLYMLCIIFVFTLIIGIHTMNPLINGRLFG